MSNAAAAIRAAVLAEHPEAEVVERGERFIRHGLPGGRYILDSGIGALHYDDSGSWNEVDTAWEDDADPDYSDKAEKMRYRVHSSGDGKRKVYPRRNVSDEYIEFGRPEYWAKSESAWKPIPLGQRQRSGNEVYWDRPNFRLSVKLGGERLKLDIILKNGNAAKRIRWPMSATGLRREGRQLLSNADDEVVLTLAKPYLIDADGVERDVAFSYSSGYAEVTADVAGLTYPITLDPTLDLQVGSGGNDGMFEQVSGSNFNNSGNGMEVGDLTYEPAAAFMRFTGVSGLSGAAIDVAYIQCYRYGYIGNETKTTIYAEDAAAPTAISSAADGRSRVRTTAGVDWDSPFSSNWNTSPSIVTVIQELADSYDPTVIQILQDDNGSPNNRMVEWITYEGSGGPEAPKLHIEYTAAGVIAPTGIASAEAFGTPSIVWPLDITVPSRSYAYTTDRSRNFNFKALNRSFNFVTEDIRMADSLGDIIVSAPKYHGSIEEVPYTITVTGASTISSPTIQAAYEQASGSRVGPNVASTVFPSGSPSANSNVITLPTMKNLKPGLVYRIWIKATIDGVVRSIVVKVEGISERIHG